MESSYTAGGNVIGTTAMEHSMEVLKKKKQLKIELLNDSAIPLLDNYLQKTRIQKGVCTIHVCVQLIHPAVQQKLTQYRKATILQEKLILKKIHTLQGSLLLLSLLFSCQVMSDSLRPHGLQYTRSPCLSLSPGVCANSCLLSQ